MSDLPKPRAYINVYIADLGRRGDSYLQELSWEKGYNAAEIQPLFTEQQMIEYRNAKDDK